LLQTLEYTPFRPGPWQGRVPKLNTTALGESLEACLARNRGRLGDCLSRRPTPHSLAYKKTAYNWLNFCRRLPPCENANGQAIAHTQYDWLHFATAEQRDLAFLLLNGKWVFAFWAIVGDDFHVARWMFADFPLDLAHLPEHAVTRLRPLVSDLDHAMRQAVSFKRNAGKRVGTYNLARCRHVTDQSDRIFAEVLGLTAVWPDLELLVNQVVRTEFGVSTNPD